MITQNKRKITNWDQLPVVLDIQDLCLIFDTTDVTIKHMIYRGDLKATKFGTKWIFDKEYIKSIVQGE